MTHPESAVLEALVADVLPAAQRAALEAHIDRCDACTARLMAYAQEAVALHEVAEAAAAEAAVPRRARWPLLGSAIAAAVLLAWLAVPESAEEVPAAPQAVLVSRCATEPGEQCLEAADQQGLMVGNVVPRYESWAPGMARYDVPGMP